MKRGLVRRNVAVDATNKPTADDKPADCWDAREARTFMTAVKAEGNKQVAAMFSRTSSRGV